MMKDLPACSNCEFSEMHASNDALFYCRRRAPSIVRGENALWPVTSEEDWCGEYRKDKDA